MNLNWIADRTKAFDSSGIRKVFDLAAKLKDPVNLSIGQPDFDVPQRVRQSCIDAIESGKNGYALTQGMPILRDKLQQQVDAQFGHADRKVFVCSGTSGGLVLTMMTMVNPGDEVIIFDPYFVMYESLVKLVGGVPVIIDTYPDFQIDLDAVKQRITDKTKLILFNSPANPTGVVASREKTQAIAELAAQRNIALISDEIYSKFCYDEALTSPAEFNSDTIVIDGFSKSYGMTGWRVGYVHGPAEVIDTMVKLQQYTFVCAPQPAQWACATALDEDISGYVDQYRDKRNRMIDGLKDHFDVTVPGGAFYVFPKAPIASGAEFVQKAIERSLLIIPGNIFSKRDSHFRISYAADDKVIDRGIEILQRLAEDLR
ncbi:MAG: aminotransferase class I/II-fold pyridoxal phosphate-dependent enzyme [Planctomycetales bacterium]|nr:aminotransferase class I/II-fold pyridoxal phosphate-dependent enzyme [Planctomycetales bacterium]